MSEKISDKIIKLQYNSNYDDFAIKVTHLNQDEPTEHSRQVISLTFQETGIVLELMELMRKHKIRDLTIENLAISDKK